MSTLLSSSPLARGGGSVLCLRGNGIDGSYDSPHSLQVLAKCSILFHIHTLGASHGPLWAFAWSPGCLCNIEVTEYKDQGRCCSLTYLLLTQPFCCSWDRQDREAETQQFTWQCRIRVGSQSYSTQSRRLRVINFKFPPGTGEESVTKQQVQQEVRPVLVEPRALSCRHRFLWELLNVRIQFIF